jgi:hypothetical protein
MLFSELMSLASTPALYMRYNRQDLAKILNENRDTLTQHGWPTAVDDFIRRIASEWLDLGNPIIAVIRKSFGEG